MGLIVRFNIKKIFKSVRQSPEKHPDSFLQDVAGVVHVGANTGQGRRLYNNIGLRVVWIEPIPEIFAELKENIKGFPDQRAYQALITNIDDKEYQLHIANNNGASSSILELKQHKDIWPDVNYTGTISLNSTTLASLFERERINPCDYEALVMDTQGSELLVLQGSIPILENFKYIKTEVADFESYEGCCQLDDISEFMEEHGYKEFSRDKFASRESGGNYYDIVFKREEKQGEY